MTQVAARATEPRRAVHNIVVVGASLAGLSTARELRAQGYQGVLTVIGDELHRPYDRPPLSKQFLHLIDGEVDALEADDEDLAVTWRLGARAVELLPRSPACAQVRLSDGDVLDADAVVITVGAVAQRNLPGVGLPGVHLLRTADDALALRADLHHAAGSGEPVVVVGGGFIGSEVAATARQLGCAVTLVVPDDVPLRAALGCYADAVADLPSPTTRTVSSTPWRSDRSARRVSLPCSAAEANPSRCSLSTSPEYFSGVRRKLVITLAEGDLA